MGEGGVWEWEWVWKWEWEGAWGRTDKQRLEKNCICLSQWSLSVVTVGADTPLGQTAGSPVPLCGPSTWQPGLHPCGTATWA